MVQVRWADRGDAPKVYPLVRALVEAEQGTPPTPSGFSRTWGRSFAERSTFRFAVAETDEKAIVGSVSLHAHFSTWKGRPAVSLEDFFVLETHRGKGVGQAMLDFAEAYAKEIGAARIELHVRRDNERAQKLYLRNGYADQPYLYYHKAIEAPEPKPVPRSERPRPVRRARRAGRRRRGRSE